MNTFTKKDLKQGMIIKTSGGQWGIVVIKDSTDENCIKLFGYDHDLLINHGFRDERLIIPLENVTNDLKVQMNGENVFSIASVYEPMLIYSDKGIPNFALKDIDK